MLAVLETIAILLIFISKSDAFFTFCKHLVLSLCPFLLTIKISVLLQKARSEIKKKRHVRTFNNIETRYRTPPMHSSWRALGYSSQIYWRRNIGWFKKKTQKVLFNLVNIKIWVELFWEYDQWDFHPIYSSINCGFFTWLRDIVKFLLDNFQVNYDR